MFSIEQIALTVHITTVFALAAVVLYTDHLGLSWMRGKVATLPLQTITLLHRLVWAGLAIMLLSGGTMFLSYREYLLTVPAFYIKAGFIATLIVNAFFIGRLMHVAAERPFGELTRRERLPLFISGAVSTICWIGTILAARNLGL